MRQFAFALLLALLAPPAWAVAAVSPEKTAAICDTAAARGARSGDAPLDVLRALTRTETGRRVDGALRPWPWTVNMEGEGFWFDSATEALAFVRRRHAEGARSFDVGCFQINFRWHGEAFESFEEMFDPTANALYAARFLAELKAEGGGWRAAVGRYHSRTPKYAQRYTARYDEILAALEPAGVLPRLTRPEGGGGGAWPPFFAETEGRRAPGALFAVAAPAHADPDGARRNWRGGVGLGALIAARPDQQPLLRKARPLFD